MDNEQATRALLALLVRELRDIKSRVDLLFVEINAMRLERKKDVSSDQDILCDVVDESNNQSGCCLDSEGSDVGGHECPEGGCTCNTGGCYNGCEGD